MRPLPPDTLVDVRDASFGYRGRAVVRADALTIRAGACLGVFGPNGAGKTTLVRGLTGLLKPLTGSVTPRAHLRWGYMPQHRGLELHWPMTGLDAAAMPLSAGRRLGWIGRQRAVVRAALTEMGVEPLAHRRFAELSGGQQQRILLAGVLACAPDVLVLDEPTDGLDVHSRDALMQVLWAQAGKGRGIVIISHAMEDLARICQAVAWLHVADEPGQPSRVEVVKPQALAPPALAGSVPT